jgi:hypothetical protein
VLDVFALDGGFSAGLALGPPGVDDDLTGDVKSRVYLKNKLANRYSLESGSPVNVSFGGLASAGVVVLRCTGKILARLTSANGAQQVVPVDSLLVLLSGSVPITAIDLTRAASTATLVQVFLGENQ